MGSIRSLIFFDGSFLARLSAFDVFALVAFCLSPVLEGLAVWNASRAIISEARALAPRGFPPVLAGSKGAFVVVELVPPNPEWAFGVESDFTFGDAS